MSEMISLLVDTVVVETGARVAERLLPASFKKSRLTHLLIGLMIWVPLFILAVLVIKAIVA